MESLDYEALEKKRLDADAMCAALHEAGHAMLADALNVGIECAPIKGLRDPQAKPSAYVHLKPGPVEHKIVIALAGRAVDRSLSADDHCQTNFMMYETDERRLEESRIRLFPDQKPGSEGYFHYNRTFPIIQNGWVLPWIRENEDAVRRFAALLMEKRELCGEELSICLREAWNGKKPSFRSLDQQVKEQVAQLSLS
jgi:hypothetical protein